MRARDLVPILSLAFVATVTWIGCRDSSAFEFPFDEPPLQEAIPSPEPPVGTEVLRGFVLGPSGETLRNAVVSTIVRGRLLFDYSDENGRFEIAEVISGPTRLAVMAESYGAREFDIVISATPVRIELEAHPAEPVIQRIERTNLAGRVEMPHLGDDPTGYEVALLPRAQPDNLSGTLPRRARVVGDGTYEFDDLAHGTYQVLLLPPWAAGGDWPNLLRDLDDFLDKELRHPRSAPSEPYLLESRAGEVSGQLPDRRPGGISEKLPYIENAVVVIRPSADAAEEAVSPRIWPPAATDAEGHFLLRDLPPGKYLVQISAGALRLDEIVQVRSKATVDLDL